MRLSEERHIDAPPEVVWAGLMDCELLQASVPGCESLTGSFEDGFEAVVAQKVGPVQARFRGTITVSDIVAGERATLSGEGKGGAAGFAKGVAHVRLAPEGDGTTLSYDVEAKVGGKLAQLGSRIIDGVAHKMADAFFTRFQAAVEAGDSAGAQAGERAGERAVDPAGEQPGDPAPDDPAAGGASPRPGWLRRMTGRE
jgi:uncharacterized protein